MRFGDEQAMTMFIAERSTGHATRVARGEYITWDVTRDDASRAKTDRDLIRTPGRIVAAPPI
jgi:hypothetical protein